MAIDQERKRLNPGSTLFKSNDAYFNEPLQPFERGSVEAEDIIRKLGLMPLKREGGFFRRTYCREHDSAAIFYLIRSGDFSHLHRLSVDEVYLFYLGDTVELVELLPDGSGRKTLIGSDIDHDQNVQHVVRAGSWQGSSLIGDGKWALLGTTTCPAYTDDCYEHGDAASLALQYPDWIDDIKKLTAESPPHRHPDPPPVILIPPRHPERLSVILSEAKDLPRRAPRPPASRHLSPFPSS